MNHHSSYAARKMAVNVAAAFTLGAVHAPALADERGDLEQLRATTLSLIEALVDNGVISRDKADKLLKDAEAKTKLRMAANAAAPALAPAPEIGKDGKRVVRVPFVPESTKREIREQVKQEVLAQAKAERWANPGALPEWLDRFQFEGDVRLRAESFMLDRGNTAAGGAHSTAGVLTRAADLAGSVAGTVPNVNTTEDFSRTRLRLRFGAAAKISDVVTAGFRISTGNTTGPTSTNQTMGQGFNRYTLVLDRGYIALKPFEGMTISGGRMANPFVGTDLLWADDLGFEGVAASYAKRLTPALTGFVSAGWFPLRTDTPLATSSRELSAMQAGVNWKSAGGSEFKLAAALYQYRGITGKTEDRSRVPPVGVLAADYGTRDEYPASIRQRGNTLFAVNALGDATQPTFWGLASEFRTFNLVANLDIAAFDPVHVVLTADYVKNLAFDRQAILQRTGRQVVDGRDTGYLGRILVGHPAMQHSGDWNVSLTYRWLGSDAVLDAFTNSDFGLGGTNNKGYILGANYGLDKNTWVSVRWMASSLIDSTAPKLMGGVTAQTRLTADLLQIDLNAKF